MPMFPRVKMCPTCKSSDKMIRGFLETSPASDGMCVDSFHPAQAMPTVGLSTLKSSCGPHCGVKDRMEGHCDCKDCHNGKAKQSGLSRLRSLDGKSVNGVRPD